MKRVARIEGIFCNDRLARLAGLLYLILLPTTGPAYFSGQLAVAGDATTALANIQASRVVFELVIILGTIGFVDWLVLGVVLHRLFSPVSKIAANLLLAFVSASTLLAIAALAKRMDVLSLLDSSRVLGLDQLQSQVVQTLHSSNNLMLTSVIFWGLWLLPFGWLVLRSGVAPTVLGILMLVGVAWYLLTFVGTVLDASYQDTLLARVAGIVLGIPGTIGELGTALWLLIKGVPSRQPAT